MYLSGWNVSHNQLSGRLPSANQLPVAFVSLDFSFNSITGTSQPQLLPLLELPSLCCAASHSGFLRRMCHCVYPHSAYEPPTWPSMTLCAYAAAVQVPSQMIGIRLKVFLTCYRTTTPTIDFIRTYTCRGTRCGTAYLSCVCVCDKEVRLRIVPPDTLSLAGHFWHNPRVLGSAAFRIYRDTSSC